MLDLLIQMINQLFLLLLMSPLQMLKIGCQKNIEFWREIGASPWVLKVLEEGHVIPFLEIPQKVSFKNNKSALNHPDFVSSEVLNLLDLSV